MFRPSPSPLLCIVIGLLMLTSMGCASSPDDEVDPFAMAEQDEPDLLDRQRDTDEDERRSRPRTRQPGDDGDEMFIIPEADSQPARSIDAAPTGWDLDDRRVFDSRTNVYEGHRHWDGPHDTSFSAIVDSDDGHLYFFVEVTDDQLLDSPPRNPADAVRIHLRDPHLDDLLDALPRSLRERIDVEIESTYTITPDGATYPESDAIHTATRRTDDGYLLEAAFSLEAMSYIGEMPLGRVAFRIDVFDGDEPQSSEAQKRLSSIVDDDGQPRFAAIATGDGLLPTAAPDRGPPRPDALGMWRHSDDGWAFQTIEYISNNWTTIDDLHSVATDVADSADLPAICDDPDSQRRMVEAYEHRSGSYRVALALCGTAPSADRCPAEASTQLVWTSLRPDADSWAADQTHVVFQQPLEQCPTSAPSNETLHHSFSLLPFDAIGSQVWGIGYQTSLEGSRHRVEEKAVRLVDPRSPDFSLVDRHLERTYLSGLERILYDSRVYVTDLDGDGNFDLCEVESIREQRCDSFDSGCETQPRGHEVIAHIDLWDGDEHRFEDFLLTRHQNCRGSTGFEDIAPGYKIIVIGNRLGLVPTMTN